MKTLRIPYESEGFPPNTVQNGKSELCVTWDDILWAAVTVGRPDWFHVFRHGDPSGYEALFRLSLVRMALEQRSPRTRFLTRTKAANVLDPTEKGMVNYFLGMTFCKLFCAKLLNTPWLLHLDVFRPTLDPKLDSALSRRSRPDLVGQDSSLNQWHGFECKGRVSPPDFEVKNKAKDQAQRLISINGVPCSLHVGTVTYFRNDYLNFYWRDPPPQDDEPIPLRLPEDAWGYHYSPVTELITASNSGALMDSRADVAATGILPKGHSTENLQVPIGPCDLEIGVHRAIESHFLAQEWQQVRHAAIHAADEIRKEGFQADGLRVCAGNSWDEEYQESIRFGDQ